MGQAKLSATLLLLALLLGGAAAQEQSKKKKETAGQAVSPAAVQGPVVGSGTPGRVTKFAGVSGSNTYVLGDSTISEDKFGNVGVGAAPLPTSRLTVAGIIESLAGGIKFPDGTIQTTSATGAFFSIPHDATLTGNGTTSSPLGVAVPLSLTGNLAGRILTVKNSESTGSGEGVQIIAGPGAVGLTASVTSSSDSGGMGIDASGGNTTGVGIRGGIGVMASGGSSPSFGGPGVEAFGGSGLANKGGPGVRATGGVSTAPSGTPGAGVDATGGNGNNGAEGVKATGGVGDNQGGPGVDAEGGNGNNGKGGDGLRSVGGTSFNSIGGLGVFARGGHSDDQTGGHGVSALGGDSDTEIGGNGINATGGSGPMGNGLAGKFNGDVEITGNLNVTGATKNFKIDHPLDPENKYLYHAAIESSEVLNVYSGNIVLGSNGEAVVQLPGWFQALNTRFRYQLTCVGGFAPVYIARKIERNRFKIAGGKPGMEVSWQVTGVRADRAMLRRPFKAEDDKPEQERGQYLQPELYGQPEERGIEWARNPEMMKERKEARERAKLKDR
jgi:hypothetical protein